MEPTSYYNICILYIMYTCHVLHKSVRFYFEHSYMAKLDNSTGDFFK